MAYYNINDDLEDRRSVIACRYLRGWFWVDFVSIFPLGLIIDTNDYSSLARIARLPKLYRLVKMTKLFRVLKVLKERSTLTKYLNEIF